MICSRCKGVFFGQPVEARFPDGSFAMVSKICQGKLLRGGDAQPKRKAKPRSQRPAYPDLFEVRV